MANGAIVSQLQERARASLVGSAVGAEVFHIGSPSDQQRSEFQSVRSRSTQQSLPTHPSTSPVSFGPIGSPSISGSAPPGGAMSSPGMMSDIGQSFCAGNPSSGGGSGGVQMPSIFFCCIAELAIKPCRSSRSNCAENSGFQTLAKQETKTPQSKKTPPSPKHNTTQKPASVWNVKREVRKG